MWFKETYFLFDYYSDRICQFLNQSHSQKTLFIQLKIQMRNDKYI